ncbi:LytR/AlgR family response regulator transcription factor [Mongoliitalea lutea]|uniref:DNA-binding response regulator n=1 Tax=Mongoliitalea lutea TaxID=849756 RepID=A0A8J3CVH4_9BACT|nr:response regulator [Mongoliitalea lutea]GHB27197.1 DNA-binding response regulator [Mongoliitalea lutea]
MLCEQIDSIEVVKAFNNTDNFIRESMSLTYDFCILDIEMPGMDGLQIANLLNGKPVIFATAYKEYAAEAYDLNAIDYIRKPVKLERLKQAIEKAQKNIKTQLYTPQKNFVQLNTDKGKAILFFEKIAFIQTSSVDSRDKIAHLFDGDEFVLKNITFEKLLELLPSAEFCRINKKEIISLKTVQVFSFDEISSNLPNGAGKFLSFTLSENYRNQFLEKIR